MSCHNSFGNEPMNVREIVRMIEQDGWHLKRTNGSHRIYRHDTKPGIVVMSYHRLSDEVKKGTAHSILKQAGLK